MINENIGQGTQNIKVGAENWLKIPQGHQNICLLKLGIIEKKSSRWVFVVRDLRDAIMHLAILELASDSAVLSSL